ncbi:MAG: hypothetical protein U9Q80_06655 [Bacillota bacterium]|nr:hypothetical protein [Bacillota bacterium]
MNKILLNVRLSHLQFLGINLLGNYWFDRNPVYKAFENYQYVSSGDIDFNNGTIGPNAYHKVEIADHHRKIDAFAQRPFPDFFNKIVITIMDSYGNQKAAKSVTHDQHLYYTTSSSDSIGDWKVMYTEEGGTKWDCWLFLWNSDVYTSALSNAVGPKSVSIYDLNTYEISDMLVYITEDDTYVIPSTFHENKESTSRDNSQPLDIEGLMNETYDQTILKNVYNLKNFSIGDTVLFSDDIENIYYDVKSDATYFILHNNQSDEDIMWPFSGNLTSRYKVGDRLNLKYKVVEKYSDDNIVFETLDYVEESISKIYNGEFADISNYICQ